MNIIIWIIVGFIVGFIVHRVDPGDAKGGISATILLGIAGAIVGGFLSVLIFHAPLDILSLQGFVTALAGAFLLALLHRVFFRGHDKIKTSKTQLR